MTPQLLWDRRPWRRERDGEGGVCHGYGHGFLDTVSKSVENPKSEVTRIEGSMGGSTADLYGGVPGLTCFAVVLDALFKVT